MTYAHDDTADPGAPAQGERAGSRRALGCAFEIVETLVLTLVIYLVIHNFVAQPFEVQQDSMFPTIVEGEYILIDKLTPRFGDYQYGDVVVFEPPTSSGLTTDGIPFIKRVIGLPGDTVSLENGRVFVTRPGRPCASRSRTSYGRGWLDQEGDAALAEELVNGQAFEDPVDEPARQQRAQIRSQDQREGGQ